MGMPGPQFNRKEFSDLIKDMKAQDEYKDSPLLPVQEVLLHSFIHRKDTSNPASISTGLLTGGDPLWGFTIGEGNGHGDLYYFVFDTKVIDHRADGTWVVELLDLKLAKAQIAADGYKPDLKKILESSIRMFGGYTKFTSGMIYRAAEKLIHFSGCMHAKMPYIHFINDMNGAKFLVDAICDHRVMPHMSMPINLGKDDKLLQAGLPGRLMDYYPKVEFMVWRKDHCPELEIPLSDDEKKFEEEGIEKYWKEFKKNFIFWEIQSDGVAISRWLHKPENKTHLIDAEALLQGWSEKVFSSDETIKLWGRAFQKKLGKGCELS